MNLVIFAASFLIECGMLEGARAPFIDTELDLHQALVCRRTEDVNGLTTVNIAASVTSDIGLK